MLHSIICSHAAGKEELSRQIHLLCYMWHIAQLLDHLRVCVCQTHWVPLAQAAQQQCCVGGHDAVLHVLPCMLQSWKNEIFHYIIFLISTNIFTTKNTHLTFVEVQLPLLLFLLPILFVIILSTRVVIVVIGNPLDLPTCLLPLTTLVQRRLRRLFDEVICLRLSQDGSLFPLEEQLRENRLYLYGKNYSSDRWFDFVSL